MPVSSTGDITLHSFINSLDIRKESMAMQSLHPSFSDMQGVKEMRVPKGRGMKTPTRLEECDHVMVVYDDEDANVIKLCVSELGTMPGLSTCSKFKEAVYAPAYEDEDTISTVSIHSLSPSFSCCHLSSGHSNWQSPLPHQKERKSEESAFTSSYVKIDISPVATVSSINHTDDIATASILQNLNVNALATTDNTNLREAKLHARKRTHIFISPKEHFNKECSARTLGTVRSREGLPSNPTKEDVFKVLPRHLIRSGLLSQAISTLKDARYLTHRIETLGVIQAAEVHVLDCECLQRRDPAVVATPGRPLGHNCGENDSDDMIITATTSKDFDDRRQQSTQRKKNTLELDSKRITLDSFQIFKKCVLSSSGIKSKKRSTTAHEDDCSFDEKGNNSNTKYGEKHSAASITSSAIFTSDAGMALFKLAQSLHDREWYNEAFYFYRHSLALLLLKLDCPCCQLLTTENKLTSSYDANFVTDLSMSEETRLSTKEHETIATVLTRIGDMHGKRYQLKEALHVYRASLMIWTCFVKTHGITSVVSPINLDDLTTQPVSSTPTVAPSSLLNTTGVDTGPYHACATAGIALSLDRMGGIYCLKGELRSALQSYKSALHMQELHFGGRRDELEVAKILHNIGVIHRHSNNLDAAFKHYIEALDIFRKKLGDDHLDVARTLHNLGGVHRRRREYVKAMGCFREVLRVRRNLLGDYHPSVSLTLISMGAVLRRSGQVEESYKYYKEAMK